MYSSRKSIARPNSQRAFEENLDDMRLDGDLSAIVEENEEDLSEMFIKSLDKINESAEDTENDLPVNEEKTEMFIDSPRKPAVTPEKPVDDDSIEPIIQQIQNQRKLLSESFDKMIESRKETGN